ncbi:hypothetical protein JKP88DRAFT_277064 [Tribonema minus]|uniref:Uncharacterized protein n=1 Tax=Tribonema minus TaxID=303371 RepID=A0A835YZW1_9STRA|nr:hypothetical protein JKP88DRAFT_277064 [Tribonema minus]
MPRTEAQQAAFAKCLAARRASLEAKAATAADPPAPAEVAPAPPAEVVPVPKVVPAPVVACAPAPAPEAAAPALEDASDDDMDVDFIDAEVFMERIHAHTDELAGLKEQVAALRASHGEVVQDMKRAKFTAAHTVNFV